MSNRQAYLSTSNDGILGGAFVVVGFVVLVVATAVDMITSRWSTPTFETPQHKEESLQATDASPASVNDSPADSQHVSDLKPAQDTQVPVPSVLPPTDTTPVPERPQEDTQLGHTLIPNLDNDKPAVQVVEQSTPEVQPQDQTESAPIAVPVPVSEEIATATDSSQEWVSLSKPDDTLPSDVQSTPLILSEQESREPSALISAPTNLHEQASTPSLPAPSTPEPDTQFFESDPQLSTRHADPEPQAATLIHPESTTRSTAEGSGIARTSNPSLRSASGSINKSGTVAGAVPSSSDLSPKKNRRPGSSFIKRSSTLLGFKSTTKPDTTNNNNDSPRSSFDSPRPAAPLVSSSQLLSEPDDDALDQSVSSLTGGADYHSSAVTTTTTTTTKKQQLTSPSRVSLGSMSIRSIGGSIKKKMGKGSETQAPVEDLHVPSTANASANAGKVPAEAGSGPSLLKTMFKVRKPSK